MPAPVHALRVTVVARVAWRPPRQWETDLLRGRVVAAEMSPDEATRGLAAIVLAAGGASRFGGPKQLARIGAVSLVRRAAHLALLSCPAGVVVVTGAWAAAVEKELAGLPLRPCRNPRWRAGMAGSLRRGLDALPRAATACLVLLADQPLVDEADLRRLVAAWAEAPERVAAAAYDAIRGVPAIFPSAYWRQLRALRGDRGARAVIASLAQVTTVALQHAACDIDTLQDLDAVAGR